MIICIFYKDPEAEKNNLSPQQDQYRPWQLILLYNPTMD